MVKRSQILRLRNMGPFQFYPDMCFYFWHGETVSNFVAAKYGTVLNFVLKWKKGLNFCGCNIWDCFNFLSWHAWNCLKFCWRKLWDRFHFCPDLVKQSHILQMQNISSYHVQNSMLLFYDKLFSEEFYTGHMVAKWSQFSKPQNMTPWLVHKSMLVKYENFFLTKELIHGPYVTKVLKKKFKKKFRKRHLTLTRFKFCHDVHKLVSNFAVAK